MTKYQIANDQTYEAQDATELVGKMHAAAFTEAADDKAYMLDVAERMQKQNGVVVRTTSHTEFVEDLVKHGFVKVMP